MLLFTSPPLFSKNSPKKNPKRLCCNRSTCRWLFFYIWIFSISWNFFPIFIFFRLLLIDTKCMSCGFRAANRQTFFDAFVNAKEQSLQFEHCNCVCTFASMAIIDNARNDSCNLKTMCRVHRVQFGSIVIINEPLLSSTIHKHWSLIITGFKYYPLGLVVYLLFFLRSWYSMTWIDFNIFFGFENNLLTFYLGSIK